MNHKSKNRTFPFVIEAKSIAGGSVKEACFAAVELSRHLRCMVETEINDTKITVCGAIMDGNDAYKQWQHYSEIFINCPIDKYV